VIERHEIMTVASELSLAPNVIEKDYVLGWILAGIYADPELGSAWVFKGGTCLKKCFFETYRFSEDLDFTLSNVAHLDEAFLRERFSRVSDWVWDASGIELPPDQMRFEVYRNKRDQLSCQGRLPYRGPLGQGGDLPRIKLDLTADEALVRAAVSQAIGHAYSDLPGDGFFARCYDFAEIFAEKTRALGERSRPRDLYDVVNLYRLDERRPQASDVLEVLREKCRFKGIAVPTLADLTPALDELRGEWGNMLGHQLQALPPFEAYWAVMPEFFAWLATGAAPPRPVPAPLEAGARFVRLPIGRLGASGIRHARELESIRFAAASRLCVDLGYQGSIRRIEPYSLRRTSEDALLLMAVKADSGEVRSYRVDAIESVSVSSQPYVPRYVVELASAELAIQPLSRSPGPRLGGSLPPRLGRASAGLTYVIQCGICRKKFTRTTRDVQLNPHKMPSGQPCPGRRGILVTTRS
jgi:predicted nucleotidyltransferase component of viral defense system